VNTSHHPRPRLRRRALSIAIPFALCAALPLAAQAQEDPSQDATNLSKITVTGSNIPRTSTETASPVQVITRQEIDRTGKTSIGEYLQSLTVDGAGSVPKTFGNGFAMGSTGISLRGLGAGSTLVLINGRRVASYGLADDGQKVFTDLSSIPMDAVERVEVLKDGASSIYGSDAIAGVVNVILRSDFEGAIFTGSYGTSGDSDGNTRKGTLTAGTGNLDQDGWNAFFSLDVSKTDGIKISDRKNRKWIGTGDIRPWGYSSVDGASQYLGGGMTSGLPTSAPDGAYETTPGGPWARLGGCEQLSSVPQEGADSCLWDLGQFRDLTPDEKAINFFSRGTFRINDNADLYTEFGYSKKTVDFQSTPSGVSGAWGYPGGPVNASSGDGAVVLGPQHPQNPTGTPVRLRYSAFDVGPRQTHNENEFMRFLVGVKGTAADWDYDVGYLHSQSELTNTRKGFLSYSAVQCALEDPNCAGGTWLLGTQAGNNPQSLYDFISPTISARATSRLDILDAKANRSLMDLGGGSLGLAVGAEFRRNEVSLTPQTGTEDGDIIGLGYSAYDGVEKTSAVYAELAAPFTDTFEATVAGRVDHYQGGDTAFTPKVGLKWTPAEWIALRATYAEGFRAPNPAESGKGGSAGFSNIIDPVRCAAGGSCSAQSVALITTPNPDLDPEKSKSYTLGVVLQPTATTTLTLDAWQIKRTDEIGGGDPQQAIAAGDVIRGDNLVNGIPGTGQLLAINTAYVNADSTKVNGLDLDARQRFDLGEAGQLRLDVQWSHINKFEKTVGDTTYEYAGTHGNCDVTNCIGTPKDRINFGATWDISDFSISAVANYRSSIDNKTAKGEDCASSYADGSPAPGSCKLASFTTVDLSGNWQATDAFSVFASVQNVADRIAPLDPLSYGGFNYNPLDSSGAIGRFFTVGARYTF
jgi:iron complex outermembrane receptor protein